jgi:hypothetical protein
MSDPAYWPWTRDDPLWREIMTDKIIEAMDGPNGPDLRIPDRHDVLLKDHDNPEWPDKTRRARLALTAAVVRSRHNTWLHWRPRQSTLRPPLKPRLQVSAWLWEACDHQPLYFWGEFVPYLAFSFGWAYDQVDTRLQEHMPFDDFVEMFLDVIDWDTVWNSGEIDEDLKKIIGLANTKLVAEMVIKEVIGFDPKPRRKI